MGIQDTTFISDRKQHIIELLDLDEEDFDRVLSCYDINYLIYRFSTTLFDCFNLVEKEEWLSNIKEHMGEEFYYSVIEGYVLGRHDT